MVMTDPDRRRRRLSVALLIVIAILAALGALYASNGASTARDVARGNDLQACRALFRLELDDADRAADAADALAETAEAAVSDLFVEGLAAAISDDQPAVEAVIEASPGARTAAREARARAERARLAVSDVSEVYADRVALSRTDPDRFLADCETLP